MDPIDSKYVYAHGSVRYCQHYSSATNRVGVGIMETGCIIRYSLVFGSIRKMYIDVGISATEEVNSGFLLSRFTCTIDKTGNEEIIIERINGMSYEKKLNVNQVRYPLSIPVTGS